MKPFHLVVLSVSAGAGHLRAAAAVCEQAQAAGLASTHIDVMHQVPAWFRWLYADLYGTLVNRAPLLWRWLYGRMNHAGRHGRLQRLRRLLEHRLSARWLAQVAALAPDAILCTHFLPAEVLARHAGAGGAACPIFVHVTDFDLHAMWVQPGVDGYFVGCDEVAFQLRRAGVAGACITVSGMALMQAFALATPSPQGLQHYFEGAALPLLPVVLLMGGGGGFGGLEQLARQLLEAESGFRLLVVAGKNEAALAALQALAPAWPGRLAALGFTDQVATLMGGADIVITKPGGLTSAECLAVGVAMIVNAPIPGQEERNADYLLEQGVALKAVDAVTLAWRLRQLLAHPQQRRAMAARARSLGRPAAARQIVEAIVGRRKAAS
ncbi:MGDG synthase family glycosyltransferase [Massilia sp. DWR3-1-1]|uniref:MGDG synthase family glycosyltransferase n=1 Tax=Massilia sp. DWR3-1-1 TaxID=2804559 RepID=UPI003CE68ED4